MTASRDQLYVAIDTEKEKLKKIVNSKEDLKKQQTIDQSCKLDKLIVLAMKDQLKEKEEKKN